MCVAHGSSHLHIIAEGNAEAAGISLQQEEMDKMYMDMALGQARQVCCELAFPQKPAGEQQGHETPHERRRLSAYF